MDFDPKTFKIDTPYVANLFPIVSGHSGGFIFLMRGVLCTQMRTDLYKQHFRRCGPAHPYYQRMTPNGADIARRNNGKQNNL